MQPLTSKQKKIRDFILRTIRETGTTPSLNDIAEEFEMTKTGALRHLEALERKDYIRRDAGAHFFQIAGSDGVAYVPVVGNVAAGQPILAEENITGYEAVSQSLARWSGVFLLRVGGDSMDGAHILDGDLVLVRPIPVAENRDIVVALVGDEDATVKRYFRRGSEIELRPENPKYSAIRGKDNIKILGKVIGVIRKTHEQ